MKSGMITILHADIQHGHVAEWSWTPHRPDPHQHAHRGREHGHDDGPQPHPAAHAPQSPTAEASAPPHTATLLNAANWTYDRDLGNLPEGLRFLQVNGQPLAQEVTADGFY